MGMLSEIKCRQFTSRLSTNRQIEMPSAEPNPDEEIRPAPRREGEVETGDAKHGRCEIGWLSDQDCTRQLRASLTINRGVPSKRCGRKWWFSPYLLAAGCTKHCEGVQNRFASTRQSILCANRMFVGPHLLTPTHRTNGHCMLVRTQTGSTQSIDFSCTLVNRQTVRGD